MAEPDGHRQIPFRRRFDGFRALNGKGVATFTYSALRPERTPSRPAMLGRQRRGQHLGGVFRDRGNHCDGDRPGRLDNHRHQPQVILVATVWAPRPTPTGTVTFYNGATEVAPRRWIRAGRDPVPICPPAITAGGKYSGDALHTRPPRTVTISSIPMGFNLAVTPPR